MTVKDVQVTVGGDFGIALTHTKGVTIENSTISGLNATVGRVGSAIDDEYGDSTGIVISANNISAFKTAIQISSGLADANYIHDPGYLVGDHTNGFFTNGGSQALTIENNTIFDGLNQTDGINLDAGSAGVPVANKTVEGNFLAGGVLHHLRRHHPEQPHLQHRHQGQPVRPAIPRAERPVRPRRLLQPQPRQATAGQPTSGTAPAGPFPPRDRRTTTGRRHPLACLRRGQAGRPVGPAELARQVGLNTTMIGTSPVPGLSARSGHLAQGGTVRQRAGLGRPLSAVPVTTNRVISSLLVRIEARLHSGSPHHSAF